MQQPNKFICTLGAMVLLGVGGTAHSAVTLSADESVRDVATDHQNEVSKDKAKKNLGKAIKKVEKNFSKKDMVSFIGEAWHHGLNVIYKMPVYDDKSDKQLFIEQAMMGSLNACFDDLDR